MPHFVNFFYFLITFSTLFYIVIAHYFLCDFSKKLKISRILMLQYLFHKYALLSESNITENFLSYTNVIKSIKMTSNSKQRTGKKHRKQRQKCEKLVSKKCVEKASSGKWGSLGQI